MLCIAFLPPKHFIHCCIFQTELFLSVKKIMLNWVSPVWCAGLMQLKTGINFTLKWTKPNSRFSFLYGLSFKLPVQNVNWQLSSLILPSGSWKQEHAKLDQEKERRQVEESSVCQEKKRFHGRKGFLRKLRTSKLAGFFNAVISIIILLCRENKRPISQDNVSWENNLFSRDLGIIMENSKMSVWSSFQPSRSLSWLSGWIHNWTGSEGR